MQRPVYLDYAATTPVDPRVAEAMGKCLTLDGNFGNPASRSHLYGWKAEEAVETARRNLADLIGADPREIVWTSGATESDNLAIKGVARRNREAGQHIITSSIEHKAVLDVCAQLEAEGFEVTYLTPDSEGRIAPGLVAEALRTDTILVSLMHVNNEIGVITDITAIGEICREREVIFHVDAAQSVGKIPVDLTTMKVDLLSISAHKMYGPKGIGALYVRRRPPVELEAQIHGGGHERGLRSGTLPTHQIVGLGEAARIAREEMVEESARILALRNRFCQGIQKIDQVRVNGSLNERVPGNLNVGFAFVDGESLLMSLRELAISSGSACTSASLEPSYVLRALGVDSELAHSSVRFSFGRYSTQADVDFAMEKVQVAVARLREQSPVWKRYQQSADTRELTSE
jgi:cysteine desulfurase